MFDVIHTKIGTPSTEILVFNLASCNYSEVVGLPLINEFTIPYPVDLSTNSKNSVSYIINASGDVGLYINVSYILLLIQ
jgi:hypothetical protein